MKIYGRVVTRMFDIREMKISLAKGEAAYTMKRGAFKSTDRTTGKINLSFKKVDDNQYTFAYENIEVVIRKIANCLNISCNSKEYNRFYLTYKSDSNEELYGCGEQFTRNNLKGELVKNWVSEHHTIAKLLKKTIRYRLTGTRFAYDSGYKNHQTYFASSVYMSNKKYFVFVDTDVYSEFDFTKDDSICIAVREIPEKIYIQHADSYQELSSELLNLIGINPRLPEWVDEGAIIASQGGIDKAISKVEKALEKGAKVKGIWCQDWSGQILTSFGTQVYWDWIYDEKLYHDLKEKIKYLNSKGVKFLAYINTFLKEDTTMYNEALANDYLVKTILGAPYLVESTTFKAGIVDLTNPDAYNWYKEIIKINMIDLGISGWMADFGEYLPTDSLIYGGDAEKYHNIWPVLWAKCNYEAINERGVADEVFFFSRAAYTRSNSYTNIMWNGDQHVDFSDEEGMGSVIPATNSMAMSGVGINHSDVGGYTTIFHLRRSAELLMRWTELNVFTPMLRYHEGNRPDSNVQFDDIEVNDHFVEMTKLYKSLSPYRKYCKEEYYNKAIPVNRPLFYEYDETGLAEIKDEYLFGKDLLVVAVSRPKVKTKKVILPEDKWIHLFTKEIYEGGEHEVECPVGQPCVFYRADSEFKELFEKIGG